MTGNKKIIEILTETSELLQRKGWSRFAMARDQYGRRCGPNSIDASCYCLSGALVKSWRTLDPDHEEFYFRYFEKKLSEILMRKYGYDRTFTRWNDEVATCADDVVELINSAIASLLVEDAETGAQVEAPGLPQSEFIYAAA